MAKKVKGKNVLHSEGKKAVKNATDKRFKKLVVIEFLAMPGMTEKEYEKVFKLFARNYLTLMGKLKSMRRGNPKPEWKPIHLTLDFKSNDRIVAKTKKKAVKKIAKKSKSKRK